VLLLAFCVFLAGCSSAPPVSIPAPTVHGPLGHRFALSFLKPASEHVDQSGILVPEKYGGGTRSGWSWTSPGFNVFVDEFTKTVPSSRVNGFLRSYLPTSHGGRIITWRGFPAATESVPCSTPAGSCSGVISALVVFADKTVYDILVTTPTNSVAQKVFKTFRLIK
jgi:hypothetical protein